MIRGDALIARVVAVVLYALQPALAGPLPTALSDLNPIPPESDVECPTSGAEPPSADDAHEIEGLVGGASLSYIQALGNFRATLEANASPEALKALDASAIAKDPVAASGVAVIALAAEKPLATVAYAIKAHETAPKEPVFLVNLSGIANYFGLRREALAFAEQAETLPKNKLTKFQRAVLLSNKGSALVSLGRPEEAEAALTEAIKLAPNLPEAYTNMAYSLGDQDKCDAAMRFMRAGNTRHPSDVYKSRDPTKTIIPISQVLDLSKGKAGILPQVPIVASPEESVGVRQKLDRFKEQTEPPLHRYDEELPDAMQGMFAKRLQWADAGIAGTLTANFAEALLKTFDLYTIEVFIMYQTWLGGDEQDAHPDPELRPLAESAVRTDHKRIKALQDEDEVWGSTMHDINQEFNQAMRRCEKSRDVNTCESLAYLKRDTRTCLLGKELGAKRETVVRAYDKALRALYAESYLRASAVASYYSDPAHQKWAQLSLDNYAAGTLDRLVNGGYVVAEMYGRVVEACKAADRTPMDILFDRLKAEMEECEASAKGKVGFSVLEVTANCEQIEIGVSTPGEVGLFAQVGYKFSQRYRRITDPKERFLEQQAGRDPDVALNLPSYGAAFDGELTVFAGGQAKAEAGPGEIGAKLGGYTTFNGHGDIVDSGGKFEVSGSATAKIGNASAGAETELVSVVASRQGGDD